jgi:hypothetical protein
MILLKLAAPSNAKTITDLIDENWDPKFLVFGQNGIAAFTFCEVPIEPPPQ